MKSLVMRRLLFAVIFLSVAGPYLFSGSQAQAQCAQGIPCAGNPMGIPPSVPNSPYHVPEDYPPPNVPNMPQPRWQETWGAIALDMSGGRAGMSDTEKSEAAAKSVALDRCRSSGGTRCEVRTTYHNQCVALAQERGGGEVVTATNPSKRDAETRSVNKCGGEARCAVVYSACSDAVRVPSPRTLLR